MNNSTNSAEEKTVLQLRRELEETRFRLYSLEMSRPLRLAVLINKIRKNPGKSLSYAKDFTKTLKKVDIPRPDLAAIKPDVKAYPANIYDANPLLKYPHIKVACLGCIDEFADVCHAFNIGDTNWMNLLEFGIDFIAINNASYTSEPRTKGLLAKAKNQGIPLVVFVDKKEHLSDDLKNEDYIFEKNLNSQEPDFSFINIFEYNPINWQRSPNRIGTVKCTLAINNEVKIDKANPDDEQPYTAIIANSDNSLSYLDRQNMLKLGARGFPVIIFGKKLDLPFYYVRSEDEAIDLALDFKSNPELREKISIQQRREIALNHTQLERFEFLLSKLGIPERKLEMISAIVSTMRPENVGQAIENFSSQEFKNKELVLVLHGKGFDIPSIKDLIHKYDIKCKIIIKDSNSLFGDNLNEAVDACNGEYVCKMDDDDHYGKNHFNDLMAALRYSRANIVGKWSNWVYLQKNDLTTTWVIDKQESYTHHLPGGTFLVSRSLLLGLKFGRVSRAIDSELYRRAESRGVTLYSTHRYNYLRVRHGEHTYKASDADFMSRCSDPSFKGMDIVRTTT